MNPNKCKISRQKFRKKKLFERNIKLLNMEKRQFRIKITIPKKNKFTKKKKINYNGKFQKNEK